jgi:hypothetical protein
VASRRYGATKAAATMLRHVTASPSGRDTRRD